MTVKLAKTYLKDYKPSEFNIDRIHLEIDIEDAFTLVKSTLWIRKMDPAKKELTLDGIGLELIELQIDGRTLNPDEYFKAEDSLTIKQVPDSFKFESLCKIYPNKNTQLLGLYRSGNQYCTQCEAEGFRHITYFLDRP